MTEPLEPASKTGILPPDDPARTLSVVHPDDPSLPHLGLVGDTYTILLDAAQTGGRYCLIDMHVPPGGGPGLHRHDYEEMFVVLEGEIELTFRGETSVARAGQTVNVPANAPHSFRNASSRPARLLNMCTPPGEEAFFREIGVLVADRTTPPPTPNAEEEAAFRRKAQTLAPKYRTELLKPADV